MAAALATGLSWLVALGAFVLGLRHGFDADHLAAVDGMTRLNTQARRSFAPYCGVLFSLGHGLIVVISAVLIGSYAEHWQPPTWLKLGGGLVSVVVVGLLGWLNLRAVLKAEPGAVVTRIGLRSRLVGSALSAHRPWMVLLTGALFALSFDTIGIAALFAITAAGSGGSSAAIVLGLIFTVGMLLVDGINGLWLARLLASAGRRAAAASRLMGLAVAVVSLLVAALGAVTLLLPALARRIDDVQIMISVSIVLAILGCFVAGRRMEAPQDRASAVDE